MSIFSYVDGAVQALFFGIAAILILSVWFAGQDFGIIKMPDAPADGGKGRLWAGIALFCLCILASLHILPKEGDKSPDTTVEPLPKAGLGTGRVGYATLGYQFPDENKPVMFRYADTGKPSVALNNDVPTKGTILKSERNVHMRQEKSRQSMTFGVVGKGVCTRVLENPFLGSSNYWHARMQIIGCP